MTTSPLVLGPEAYPIVGHVPEFLRDRLGFLSRCAARYGDVVKLKIGEHVYLLNNAEDIKHVLATNPQNYDKTPRLMSKRGRRLSGEGLLTISGQAHRRQRRMMQPPFHHKSIVSFADTMVSTTQEMLASWHEGTVFNIPVEMANLTQRVILRALFSADLEDMDGLAAAVSTRRRYMEYMFFSLFPFPEYLPTRINLEYRSAIKRIDAFLYGVIAKRRRIADPPHDLLTMLMAAPYKEGVFMNDRQVRDEALTISITGHETIGEALSWTWYLLAQHPEAKSRLHAELSDVLGGRLPGADDFPRLKYTHSVLEESMRIYPPTWIFIRMAREDDTLPSGTRVPAGSKLYMCPYVMHRNPNYFPDPERFDPERFSDEAKRQRHRLAYFPFGHGPRVCIGEAFARLEAVLVLACVAQRFELTLVPGQQVVLEPRMTLRAKHGIMMEVVQRGA